MTLPYLNKVVLMPFGICLSFPKKDVNVIFFTDDVKSASSWKCCFSQNTEISTNHKLSFECSKTQQKDPSNYFLQTVHVTL